MTCLSASRAAVLAPAGRTWCPSSAQIPAAAAVSLGLPAELLPLRASLPGLQRLLIRVTPGLLRLVLRLRDRGEEVPFGELLGPDIPVLLEGAILGIVQLGVRHLELTLPELLLRMPRLHVLLAPGHLRPSRREPRLLPPQL